MDFLQQLHHEIDESKWDAKDEHLLNKKFQEVNEKLEKAKNHELLKLSELERQVFAFNKTPKKGVSSKLSGTKTLENGDEQPFEWPDINDWKNVDYKYIFDRFKSCKNIYAKSEYGLFLYYTKELKTNDDVKELLCTIIYLIKEYYEKAKTENEESSRYTFYLKGMLHHGIHIAQNRKKNMEIGNLLLELINLTSEIHNKWGLAEKTTLSIINGITEFTIDYFKEFKEHSDLNKYLEVNYSAAKSISTTYNWGAIYICDTSQKLADLMENKNYDWQNFKALQFEAMIDDFHKKGNLASVTFVEQALAIYKKLENKGKVEELSKKYDAIRRSFRLGEISQKLPNDETEKLIEIINREVQEKSSDQLLHIIARTPMFEPLGKVKETADKFFEKNFLSKLIPTSIIDKFGNTIDTFTTEEERKEYNFWQTYGFQFQIGAQTLVKLFIEATKAGKIGLKEIESFLMNSWIGQEYKVTYNGQTNLVRPYDVIKPGINIYFAEIETLKKDPAHIPNYIAATDSLVVQTEYILRFFCSLADIPTFTDKVKNGHRRKMEKNLDEMLSSLKHSEENPTGFFEDDRIFIQFVLSSKAGQNLRHRVAHGLMDSNEYLFSNVLLLLTIYLKLSLYTFNKNNNNESHA